MARNVYAGIEDVAKRIQRHDRNGDSLCKLQCRQRFAGCFKHHVGTADRQDFVERPFAGRIGCLALDLDIVTDLECSTPGAAIGTVHHIAARHKIHRGRNAVTGQEIHILAFGSGQQHAFVIGQGAVHIDQNLPPGRADVVADREDQIARDDVGILDRC